MDRQVNGGETFIEMHTLRDHGSRDPGRRPRSDERIAAGRDVPRQLWVSVKVVLNEPTAWPAT